MAEPYLGDTDRDARERHQAGEAAKQDPEMIEKRLWGLSYVSGGVIDYSQFELDEPVPQELGNGETTTARQWLKAAEGKTLREFATGPTAYGMEFIGSPDTVAVQMGEAMEEAGGDGFLIYAPMTRRAIVEIADGLGAALRKRGLIRSSYAHPTFRENLLDF
jgi:alkanesulfonate monooxygenase SsuD/methylene tetrahydromethanopterin reductase-like flavin-dependent oxidoreductase (luciferase family)